MYEKKKSIATRDFASSFPPFLPLARRRGGAVVLIPFFFGSLKPSTKTRGNDLGTVWLGMIITEFCTGRFIRGSRQAFLVLVRQILFYKEMFSYAIPARGTY